MNTTTRRALLELFQAITSVSQPSVYFLVPALLIAFMIYSEACLLDMKAVFVRVDRLSTKTKKADPPLQNNRGSPQGENSEWPKFKRISPELQMLERFKEAIELHRRVIQ